MSDERETTTPPSSPQAPAPGFARRHWGKLSLLSIIGIPLLGLALWVGIALSYTYSHGDRSGYVQKLSKKGWICKTWEGELAQSNLPGQAPQLFAFSVRNDSVAEAINQLMGKQVSLTYEEHKGVPTSCFGDTDYFVTAVRPAQ